MNSFVRFIQEAIQELKLSTWLTRQQMIGSTIVVVLFAAIMALYVSAVDRVLLFFTSMLFRIG